MFSHCMPIAGKSFVHSFVGYGCVMFVGWILTLDIILMRGKSYPV